jgi:xanthine dehydrogenase YagR molybdenum-binding subunit
MSNEEQVSGKPLNRVDGRLKVTGAARYASEAQVADVLYGVLVTSTIARGKVATIDTASAEKAPGVVAVLTHRNIPRIPGREEVPGTPDPAVGRPLQPFQDNTVYHNGQPIAVVVADTLERATRAAALIRATYREERAVADFISAAARAFPPTEPKAPERNRQKPAHYERGAPDKAFGEAAVQVVQTYTIPTEHHNPMEPHATLALWDGPKLTLYEKTQGVDMTQRQVSQALGIPTENVHVISPFVGGAFGTCLRTWPYTLIAALAARHVRRPVKLVLTRAQMFTMTGYRPYTVQKVELGATREGMLTAIRHEATGQTSTYEEYTETVLNPTRILYACPNVRTRYRLAAMNVNTPAPMRGPGEATGVFALESALDELAAKLKMDPVELRLRNFTDVDPQAGLPWSSNSLKECYRAAAEKFGWAGRKLQSQSMRAGRLLVGYGMATATWPTHRQPATVLVRLLADGTAVVRTATADIGPGTYTAMTQIAADALGLPAAKVHFELGDSNLPPAPIEGGSMTLASVGSAVHEAALAARDEVRKLAGTDAEGSFADILKRHNKGSLEVTHKSKIAGGGERLSMRAFGAQFVEVHVDPDLGTVRVARVVSRIAAGRIINPKTAHSQAIGGIVGGIGMAHLEYTVWDPRNARVVNANLADYHVPVNADIPDIDAEFIEEKDRHVNPLGAKGLAELALVGVAPAVANAVYHATGKRVRDLPITIEKLL